MAMLDEHPFRPLYVEVRRSLLIQSVETRRFLRQHRARLPGGKRPIYGQPANAMPRSMLRRKPHLRLTHDQPVGTKTRN